MKSLKNRKAFSLIELSLVILIIGILIVGIVHSSNLISKFRLNSARSLTQNSPVNSIGDIVLWYETTMENAFDENVVETGDLISTWHDLNIQKMLKNDATQSAVLDKPSYQEDCINSLPCVRFGESNNNTYLSFNGLSLIGSNYSLVFVEKRTSNRAANYFLGGTGAQTTNNKLAFGYELSNKLRIGHIGNASEATVPSFSLPSAVLHITTFSQTNGRDYYRNGVDTAFPVVSGSEMVPLVGYPSAVIGLSDLISKFYIGDIGEVIIFNRALKVEERVAIEEYLMNKWGIN